MKGYIYKIINVENGKFYIGSTFNPKEREKRHFNELKNRTHHSFYLQRAYDKYGVSCFRFEIVKEINLENENELRNLEERYINFCWNSGKLYNISKKGSGGDIISYHPLLEEIKEKQRKITKAKWDNKTDEEKETISKKFRGEKNPNFGNKWSCEQREKASKYFKEYYSTHDHCLKGKTFEESFGKEKAEEMKQKLSQAASKKIGNKNPFYGKHHTKETKKKISEKNKGRIPPNAKKVFYNGIIYDSAADCSRKIGVNVVTVCYRCKNQIYGFSYLNDKLNEKVAKIRWDLEKCEEIAKKCKTKKEFENNNPSAYQWVNRNGYMREISSKYFVEIRHKWTLDEILELARKYSTYSEFWNNEKKAVSTIYHNKWLKIVKGSFNK